MLTRKISLIITPLFFSALLFTSLFASFSAHADDVKADDILGFWLTEEKTGVIEIKKNTKNEYYGEIVWVKDVHTGKIKDKKDVNNPDEKLRERSILGMKNTWGFKFDGDDEWEDGNIYDPKSGKIYSAKMELEDNGQKLDLRGYVGVPLFGKTTEWTREKGRIPEYIKK